MIIKEVTTLKDKKRFIDFPNKLFKKEKNFCPPIYADELNLLIEEKNAAFEYCEAKLFLAIEGNQIVGRIMGIINKAYNEKMNVKQVRFSRLDVIDNIKVTEALIKKVEEYGKEKGMDRIIGPNGFSDLDMEGMLIEGFDHMNMNFTYYSFPYYQEHMKKLGFAKEVDWVEYKVYAPSKDAPIIRKLEKLSIRIINKSGYTIDRLKRSKKESMQMIRDGFEVINTSFKDLFGTVPFTPRQKDEFINSLFPIAKKDFTYFVRNKEGKVVALGFLLPSISKACRKTKGKLFPFGFIHFLKALHTYKVMDMYMMAILPEYQNKGVSVLIVSEALKQMCKHKTKYALTGPELEYNTKIQAQWKIFDRELIKRRRVWGKNIK